MSHQHTLQAHAATTISRACFPAHSSASSASPRLSATARTVFLLLCLFSHAATAQPTSLWWEGETPATTSVNGPSPFQPGTGGDFSLLSDGDWLSGVVTAGNAGHHAVYDIDVPADGTYEFWTRKFWRHGAFEWRFNDEPWTACTWHCNIADETELRTHVVANWVPLGNVTLGRGPQRFEWRLTGHPKDTDEAFGFDCFLLTTDPFVPRGKLRPGESDTRHEPGYFAFDPPLDTFSPEAGFDLRSMNEPVAGQLGRVARKGDGFTLADGSPVRFWGVNVPPDVGFASEQQLDHMMRKLAKVGVNLVRIHGHAWRSEPGGPIDPARLDAFHKLVAASQKHGIYSVISWYFPVWVDAPLLEIAGFENAPQPKPFAATFFHTPTQRFYFDTLRAIMTTPNPHTGKTLAEDPAVAMVEMMNEDSFFFWTFTKKHLPAPLWKQLEQQLRDHTGDARIELREAYAMTRKGYEQASRREKREIAQQVEFLAKTQHAFYSGAIQTLRGHGYAGLVVCSNWVTTDSSMLDAVERWTYTAGDVIDAHGYFEPVHEGDDASWDVRGGHKVADRFATAEPGRLPLRLNQVAGYPQYLSEVNWPQPNRSRGDMAMLGAAALSLQGADAVGWFAVRRPSLHDASMGKFAIETPSVMGAFPAAALLYRRGDIATPQPAIVESLLLDDLFQMRGSATASASALDQFRAADAGTHTEAPVTGIDPRSYYTGAVVRSFDGKLPSRTRSDLATLLDPRADIIRTQHDALRWEPQRQLAVIDTPRCVAFIGRLNDAGEISVGPVTLRSGNDYGSVTVIALDDEPIETSKRLLVQAVTHDQPLGYRVDGSGIITSMGTPPLQVRRIEAGITIKGEPIKHMTALDANAMPMTISFVLQGDSFTLPSETLYTLIER